MSDHLREDPPGSTDDKGLICKGCGCRHFNTLDTDPLPSGVVRRYKACRNCGKRTTTFELQAGTVPVGIPIRTDGTDDQHVLRMRTG